MRGSTRSSSSDGRPDFVRSPRPDRRPAPDADRASLTTSVHDVDVVPTEPRHGPGAYDVIHKANGYPLDDDRRRLHARRVEEQLERFPEGQFVAVTRAGGAEIVVGTATTMRTGRPPDAPPLGWNAVIGDYGLSNHDPEGDWLYGVEIAVHPDFQRRGIATVLYRARLALVPELGLQGWYAGGMLMGYHRYADVLTPRAYAERVIAGELIDPTVSMQLHRGLQACGIIEGYSPEPKAGDCAVLLVWRPPVAAPAKGIVQAGAGGRLRRPGGPPPRSQPAAGAPARPQAVAGGAPSGAAHAVTHAAPRPGDTRN